MELAVEFEVVVLLGLALPCFWPLPPYTDKYKLHLLEFAPEMFDNNSRNHVNSTKHSQFSSHAIWYHGTSEFTNDKATNDGLAHTQGNSYMQCTQPVCAEQIALWLKQLQCNCKLRLPAHFLYTAHCPQTQLHPHGDWILQICSIIQSWRISVHFLQPIALKLSHTPTGIGPCK